MATKSLLQAIHDGLAEEMRADERVMVLGEDVGRAGGVFRVTQGLQEEFGPARVFDTPLAESLIVGSAIGLSVNGMRPVAEIQFADFIPPAFDQIVNEAALFYYRSNGAYTAPITIRAPYGVVPGGALFHSQSVEAFFCNTPGLKAVAPTLPADATGALKRALPPPHPAALPAPAARSPPRPPPPTPRAPSRAPSATPTPSCSWSTRKPTGS